MSETPFNPNDPAFLASRSLDEELSASDRQMLDEALAESETLRAEVEELRAIDRLVRKWRRGDVEIDWTAHGELIEAMGSAEPNPDRDRALDELLAQWADRRVEIDDETLTAAVMARIPLRSRSLWARKLVFRLGGPLAAAAAVAFVVLGTLQYWSSVGPRVEVSIGPRLATVEAPSGTVRVALVSFRREPGAGFAPERASPGISFIVVGASLAPEDWSDETPPL